ncbi:MAG TPA: HAD family hydrolase [Anaerolineaceae bacterium]|nr:HAD family hydrolase [Anaerolineaceae bacterium]
MPLDLARVKGLCFDVDGTISDTDNAWVERIAQWLAPLHSVINKASARRFGRWLVMFTESPMNFVSYILDTLSMDDEFGRMFDHMRRREGAIKTKFLLMDGAADLLAAARTRYPLCVVSARDAGTTATFLNQFNLQQYFVEVVTNQTCPHTKPYPDPVIYAAQKMDLSPRDCVMIGDTTVDILAGKRAGAQTVGVLCGFGTAKELQRAGADVILNDLHEVYQLFFPY